MKQLLLIILLFSLAACARPPQTEPPTDAGMAWERMQQLSEDASNKPFRIQFSLRFGPEGNTRRVTGVMWGNNQTLVRVDLQAGIGVLAARALETRDGLVLYSPQDDKAWVREASSAPVILGGAPLPMGLGQLSELLTGHFNSVFGQTYRNSKFSGSATVFELLEPPGGELSLAANGTPVRWARQDGWNMAITYDEKDPALPHRLTFAAPPDNQGILLIRELAHPEQSFPSDQLTLELPAGTTVLPLKEQRGE